MPGVEEDDVLVEDEDAHHSLAGFGPPSESARQVAGVDAVDGVGRPVYGNC